MTLLAIGGAGPAGAYDVETIAAIEPDPQNGFYVYQLCADCHTPQGWGMPDGSIPVLAGQHRRVLIKQLADIRDGHRGNDAMFSFAQDEEVAGDRAIADVTHYISRLLMPPSPGLGRGAELEEAAEIYADQCASCHGARGEGNDRRLYPRLQGQHYGYLAKQMERIVNGYRENADPEMVEVLRHLTPIERELVADYLARMRPDPQLVAPSGWENPDFNYGIQ